MISNISKRLSTCSTYSTSKLSSCLIINRSKFFFGSKINFRLLNKEKKLRLKEKENNDHSNKNVGLVLATKSAKNFVYNSPIEAFKALKLKDLENEKKEQIDDTETQKTETADTPLPPTHKVSTVNMLIALNLQMSKNDHQVRGICKYPGGSVKIPRICVFTSGHLIEVAKEAGADLIGDDKVVEDIKKGVFNFDKLLCSIDMLATLKQLGKVLGPKGLMPNVKVGTAAKGENLEHIIKEIKLGSREFKVDKYGQVQIPIGRDDFKEEDLYRNINSFIQVLNEKKPDNVKNNYIKNAFLKSTEGMPVRIDVKSLDRKSPSYFLNALNL